MSIHVNVSSLKSAEQYRRLAREAVQHAETAPSLYFRLSYLGLAAGWRALAEESEKASHAQLQSELSALPEWAQQVVHQPV
jgi:hypothetical protein